MDPSYVDPRTCVGRSLVREDEEGVRRRPEQSRERIDLQGGGRERERKTGRKSTEFFNLSFAQREH